MENGEKMFDTHKYNIPRCQRQSSGAPVATATKCQVVGRKKSEKKLTQKKEHVREMNLF